MNFIKNIIKNIENKYIKNIMTDSDLNQISEKLNKIDENNLEYFSFKGQTFIAKHCNIYDGDTFSVIFEYRGEIIKYRCRCMGYDTAEMKPKKNDPNREYEKMQAIKAKNRLEYLLNKHPTKLIKIECLDFDKYGRLLIELWNNSIFLNQKMIDDGFAGVYDGGTKKPWREFFRH